jgi:hypothetical protein
MTSEQWHKDKVVAYIVIGIIVVVGIGLYVYMQLSAMQTQQSTVVSPVKSLGGPTVLSPVQSKAKETAIGIVTAQKPKTLTKKQSSVKAAIIEAFEMQNSK